MGKLKSRKRKNVKTVEILENENKPLPAFRMSDEPVIKKSKWINKQRVLIFAARGINYRDRHLMRDIRTIMPHHRTESKMERSKTLSVINEMCEMKHCNKVILFEGRRKQDLYMWLSNVSEGPSAKFYVQNVHTFGELKLTGNCLRGARPFLSFDTNFTKIPYLKLLKELFVQIFNVPNQHPKSQPFYDHVYTFTYIDKRIWFRNYQILSEDGGLAEIGPRFVMNPIKIFEGSFTGEALWENSDYVSPSKHRQMLKKQAKNRYTNRVEQKVNYEASKPGKSNAMNELDEIFSGNVHEKAKEFVENDTVKKSMLESGKGKSQNSFEDLVKEKRKKNAMNKIKDNQIKKSKLKTSNKLKLSKRVKKKISEQKIDE